MTADREHAPQAKNELVLYDRYGRNNAIGRLTLNRPEKLNALSVELLSELESVLKLAAWDDSVRVIVIRGAGKGFGAGYDLAAGTGDRPGQSRVTRARENLQEGARRQLMLFNLPKITIAQIHGYCLAGSCEYAMMADIAISAENATIGHPGVRGLGHPRNSCGWPMILGMRKAKELLYTGDTITGTEAARIGMINRAVPEAQLESEVTLMAERIANQTADSLAVQKEAVNRWYQAMGMESSVMAAADYDFIYQSTSSAQEFWSMVKERGMREALRWRDGRYARP